MADLTRHDMQLLDEHDRHQQAMMKEQLDQMGIQLRIAHFTGDSSYPTEYVLRYSFVEAVGPTFGLALSAFVEALLKHVPVERDLNAEIRHVQETALSDAEVEKKLEAFRIEIQQSPEKPETSYLDDPTRVEPGWLGSE